MEHVIFESSWTWLELESKGTNIKGVNHDDGKFDYTIMEPHHNLCKNKKSFSSKDENQPPLKQRKFTSSSQEKSKDASSTLSSPIVKFTREILDSESNEMACRFGKKKTYISLFLNNIL